MEYITI